MSTFYAIPCKYLHFVEDIIDWYSQELQTSLSISTGWKDEGWQMNTLQEANVTN